ncbi:hypothetical protein FOPE_04096 [Fonsecaea pedrosoi]|nr:hypothetical protein FOPE_04096 [Fonsecaea pedrosoi]
MENLFEKHEVRRYTPNVSLLYILAERNLSSLIRIHPPNPSCFDVEDEGYGPPIFAALATGSNEAVHALLEVQADTHPTTAPFRHLCEQYYRDRSNRINLGRDFFFSQRSGPLTYIAKHGDDILLALFFASGNLNIETTDDNGQTPLTLAAKNGHEMVARLLLDKGADLESRDECGRTSLLCAATYGHEMIAKLLLDKGADLEAKDYNGDAVLPFAVWRGDEEVVKLLQSYHRALP